MISPKKTKLLVTTGMTETWGESDEELIFLGDWCRPLASKNLIDKHDYNIVQYHWSNKAKLRSDYDYLEQLFEKVLLELSRSLNSFHNVTYSLRYWRIILGPWLLEYIAVLWDRWESIRLTFEKEKFDSTIILKLDNKKLISEDMNNWSKLMINDVWNHHLFSEIIQFISKDKFNIVYAPYSGSYNFNKVNKIHNSYKIKFIALLDGLFNRFQKNYKIIFVSSYFSIFNLVKLSIKLQQLPRLHLVFNRSVDFTNSLKVERDLKFNLKSSSLFEDFLKTNIINQIPMSYVERYPDFNKENSRIDINGKAIFTANAHWENDFFKIWCADKVENGNKLILSQHGGGIKSEMSNFRHQEKIADIMAVWHKPLEDVHFQLPPNKLVGFKKIKTTGKELTILGLEPKLYPTRSQSIPKGPGIYDDFFQKIEFCNNLPKFIGESIRVRSMSNGPGFFNSGQRYKDLLGERKISKHRSLQKAFKHSKIIVCTYPQTTFSEALNSGVPVILLYSKQHWEFDKNFNGLVTQLTESKILFTCPIKASSHIKDIWNNPNLWWNEDKTVKARINFFKMCGQTSENWLNTWVDFFNESIID